MTLGLWPDDGSGIDACGANDTIILTGICRSFLARGVVGFCYQRRRPATRRRNRFRATRLWV